MNDEPHGRRVADMHCHYPMHVLAGRSRAVVAQRKACFGTRLKLDRTRCALMQVAARLINSEHVWTGWRVNLHMLEDNHAGLVLSTLYDPVYEVLVVPGRQRPRPTAFRALLCQMDCVEADLNALDPHGARHVVVRNEDDLDKALATGRVAFVHAVEGGFFLGDSEQAITENIATLAGRGVAYITLAHLFYRGIASNVAALPKRFNRYYDCIFRQRERGLSSLGRAAIDAMYDHRILIDITHMDGAALNATFQRLKELDEQHGAEPHEHPVIMSHGGYRFGTHLYMLDETTVLAIKERNGIIGLILAEDEILRDLPEWHGDERLEALRCHIDKIHEITGCYDHLCIGSDLDGYTKPTIIRSWEDVAKIEHWLRENYQPEVADAILFRNAERVVASTFS